MGSMVQHNIVAMNANRNLNVTTAAQAKSTEKLSTGYKINRAADDAAGLSISEKMRRQVRGLTQASANAQDGISSVQTAEGALTEVHDMLQRMDELATKASNGTLSEGDRQNVQDEIDSLLTEIDRVSETTKFNEIYLLKGTADKTTSSKFVNAHDAGIAGTLTDNGNTATFKLDSSLEDGEKISIAGTNYTIGSGTVGGVDDYEKIATLTASTDSVSEGDSIYDKDAGTTYKLVDKVTLVDNGANAAKINGTAGLITVNDKLTVTDSNGNVTTYSLVAAADATSLNSDEIGVDDVATFVSDTLSAGGNVSYHNAVTNKDYEVVDALSQVTGADYEVSSLRPTAASVTAAMQVNEVGKFISATGVTLAEGDVITVGETSKTATDQDPKSINDISAVVGKMIAGDQIAINHLASNSTTATQNIVTIGDETNASANIYTVADAISLIGNMDDVAFYLQTTSASAITAATTAGISYDTGATAPASYAAFQNNYTAIGSGSSSDEETISKAEALSKIAAELQKASSIGTNEGSEASVRNNGDGSFTISKGSVEVKNSLSFNLHVGSDADMTNKINVSIDTMDSAGLGIKNLNVKDDSGISATYAIDAIEDAIKKVSNQRSALGAAQNRLEHTIKNLDNVVENTTSAESQIRDTDMATEMVTYSKNNILAQAGQSMLAQANQSNQGVLSLLG